MENEEVVNELEENSTETDVADVQTETTDTIDEQSPNIEPEAESQPIDLEAILKELKPQYTSEIVETDNFKLEVSHHMTAGDMLVAMLLAANIAVMLLCRLLRDRK